MDERDSIIQNLLEEITTLKKLVEQQSLRIYELEKRLTKNSSNSSKPPSSDGLSKLPRTNSLRQKGKNKSGGQLGHKGNTLRQVQTPDKIVNHKLSECPHCSTSLALVDVLRILKRQVFDIPPPKIEVTEHQVEVKFCECCQHCVTATFPYGVNSATQYGDVIQSWAVYFQQQQLIPEDRLQETFNDLFKVNLATATLTRYSELTYNNLSAFDDAVLSQIKVSAVIAI